MAKRIFNKRTLAILLTLVMLFNGFQISASAAQNTAPELVQNFADTYYKQDGTAGTANDWEIHLSKTAAPTGKDNTFDITLKIETKDTTIQTAGSTNGAAVLVLDVSNSMNDKDGSDCAVEGCDKNRNNAVHCVKFEKRSWSSSCKNCGEKETAHRNHHAYVDSKTRLKNLQDAVAAFLDVFASDAAAGEKRMIAVAVFGTDAVTIQDWVDVTNATARANLKAKINSLSTGNNAYMGDTYLCRGGTNMEAGLVLGRNLLKDTTALAGIPAANQSLILFSDGEPTAKVGNVNSTSTEKVTYGGNDTGSNTDYVDYDDISSILSGVSAAKIAVKYNYNDNSGVLKAPPFTRVINSAADTLSVDLQSEAGKVITSKTNASTVTDPMGTGVSMISVTTGYNQFTEKWNLSQLTPVVANGITTYTITYQVEIDPEAVELDANYPGYTVLTPANGATTLNYTYGEDATPVNADFNEPNIRGIRSFTVTYDYVGEVPAGVPNVPADETYKAGESVKVADAPTLENYTFSGWSKSDFVMPAEDVVITGSWTENPKYDYSLTYDANFGGNETVSDIENVTGTYATSLNIGVDANTFKRDNHTFVGWNTERDGSGTAYAVGATVALTAENNEEILYAQWIEHPKYAYSVIYNANFDSNETRSDDENVTDTYATSMNIGVDLNTFDRPNYTFIGWNTEADGSGTAYAVGETVALTAENNEEILYAQWQENPKYDYSLTYDANFGDNETKADVENISGIYATTHNITVDTNTFDRANYTFAGWNTERDGSGKVYAAGETVALTAENNTEILYAQWIENPKYDYSLTYDANFGENETKADAENIFGIYATSHNITVDANTFVRENYTFIGWNTERDGSGKAYAAGETVALTAENNTEILYAQWIENDKFNYSVTYYANFGENEFKEDAENVTATYATEYDIGVDENTFDRPNYTFIGWSAAPDGEIVYQPGDNIHFVEGGEEVLYAQWVEHPKFNYDLIYNGNGGALADGELAYGDSENVTDTYSTALDITVDANSFVRENYTFIGWNTEADGTGTAYAADDVIALTAENNTQTLYAQWIENPKYDYSVIYNANFGDNETKADAENVTGTYATALNIGVDESSFVRRGYTFNGWNTKADGTGTAYASDDVIALTAENNTQTLYAQWEINEYSYTVNYWVRVNGDAYALFSSDLGGAPVGEMAAFGTVIDQSYLEAKGLPATLTDAEFTYNFNAFEGVTVAEEGNVVNVYYTCIVEEEVEIPEEDVPLVEEPPVVEPPVVEPPVTEPPVVEPPVVEPPVTEPPATEPPATEPPVEEEVEIPEEDVPLSDIPKTGDPIFLYVCTTAASAAGLACLMLSKKKEEAEE